MTPPHPEREDLDRAKQMLRAKLAQSTDEAVRLLNEIVEPTDDNPAVQTVARALVDRRLAGLP